jgi:hypothetical protein
MEPYPNAAVKNPDEAAPEPSADESRGHAGVSPDEIARLAHSIWEARGCAGGSATEDWLRAERELRGPESRSSSLPVT